MTLFNQELFSYFRIALTGFFFSLLVSCSRPCQIENVVYDLGPFRDGIVTADLSQAMTSGIEIPTRNQVPSGYFKITFGCYPPSGPVYYYKIYYQNESYKLPEDSAGEYNPQSSSNFYGSWESASEGFRRFPAHEGEATDSIRIMGNPRDERQYFGLSFANSFWSEEDVKAESEKIRKDKNWMEKIRRKAEDNGVSIDQQIYLDAKWMLKTHQSDNKNFSREEIKAAADFIRNDAGWFASIQKKSAENRISIEEQLEKDAVWVLDHDSLRTKKNNRWKRNPRMGRYSVMIVVASEDDLARMPEGVKDISVKDPVFNDFINPFWYFRHRANADSLPNTYVYIDTNFLQVSASLDLASGIFVNGLEYPETGTVPSMPLCGWNKELYEKAHFAQFFSTLSKDLRLNTIPIVQDVNDSSYSLEEYKSALEKFLSSALRTDYIRNTDQPCRYVRYDSAGKCIEIVTPGNKDLARARKTNMGIKTRIGFTYGKITAKIKFPELINRHNVWNGLTNAFWLLFQDEAAWNQRGPCRTGYTAKGDNRDEAPRMNRTHYSEIDFEMVKTSPYWTPEYYPGRNPVPSEDGQQSSNIVVSCTNWDMTCRDGGAYKAGIDSIHYDGKIFEANRWYTAYQALTTRTAAPDDELFKSSFYYYQFEWTPAHIIWRIGPDREHLRVVGYMDRTRTQIPDNQMIAVLTQEYHLSDWWPPIPFRQEYIPFPKSDITGKLFELTVE